MKHSLYLKLVAVVIIVCSIGLAMNSCKKETGKPNPNDSTNNLDSANVFICTNKHASVLDSICNMSGTRTYQGTYSFYKSSMSSSPEPDTSYAITDTISIDVIGDSTTYISNNSYYHQKDTLTYYYTDIANEFIVFKLKGFPSEQTPEVDYYYTTNRLTYYYTIGLVNTVTISLSTL